MTCVMCSRTADEIMAAHPTGMAATFWVIALPLRRDGMTREVCAGCELEYRRSKKSNG